MRFLAWDAPLSRARTRTALALVSRPAPSIVLQPCRDVSDTITALSSGGVGRGFTLTRMPPKSRGFPVQLNLRPHICDSSINRHAVVQPPVSMQDPTMIEAGAHAFTWLRELSRWPGVTCAKSSQVCALTLQL